jgi:DNA-binding transcriptional ArsR family regulator
MQARTDPTRHLATTLRALGDETRLRIVALLARRPHYGEELAEFLSLTPATITHHVKLLRGAGLVEAKREPPYVLLHLVEGAIESVTRSLLKADLAHHLRIPSEDELSARVLRRYLDERERLTELPTARRARAVVLRWVAHRLEPDRLYPERELRMILLDLTNDPDGIRNALLDQGWLKHSGQVWRRVEEVDAL